ncbi:hypothetical protein B0H14DRAFT_2911081 [Mycena olivaceomarginata]|nr:hypothetical protein B0H14DRAFT_2911081 [Mycena olivaceomarginata]
MAMKRENATRDMSRWLVLIPPFFLSLYLPPHTWPMLPPHLLPLTSLADHHGLGTGLFKANISPLVAEQYRHTKLFVGETKSGEHVIVDPMLTVSHMYMYFYLFINFGTLVGQITMVYSEKYIGFWPPLYIREFVAATGSHPVADQACGNRWLWLIRWLPCRCRVYPLTPVHHGESYSRVQNTLYSTPQTHLGRMGGRCSSFEWTARRKS